MTVNSILKHKATAFLIPLALLATLVLLIKSNLFANNQDNLSIYITLDFILTIPLIYFLLIRKRNISNLTVAPILILSTIVASYALPSDNQALLSSIKIWLIPIVELTVITIVILKVRNAILMYKKTANKHHDFYSALEETNASLFPKTAARLVTNEIALIYYGFFNFKKISLKPNEFSNYKGSGIISTLGALIFVIGIEMITVHILLSKWSPALAWVLTILSFYSAIQLIGIIRSVPKRPITIHDNYLQLRFGILTETNISYDAIDYLELANSSDFDKEKDTKTLSLLGELEHSNIVIHLKTPQQLQFIYGKPKSYQKLLLFVDDNQNFKSQVETHLSK